MDKRSSAIVDIFSRTTIVVSIALMSGLALGHITQQSMQPKLAAERPADPVERFGLGQNAFQPPNMSISPAPAAAFRHTAASYEIGRYANGARILVPFEPARKIDRMRLERLQTWHDESYGGDGDPDEGAADYARMNREEQPPLHDGAADDPPVSVARPGPGVTHIAIGDSQPEPDRAAIAGPQLLARSKAAEQPAF